MGVLMEENLNTPQSAKFLTLSPRTLEKWRLTGGGPPFRRLGRRIVYRLADLRAWVEAN